MIGQVKVKWKRLDSDEAMWELKDAMWEAYPFLFSFVDTKDGAI